ncbi:MarR family winged helix-turn-helix transcriptional regulator [Amycolatopsis suaedae]|uniref:MarR family transcriptional regulator n=1 Tax=Amycolatopsis suaedae TaxID=2510978 RepID=A0A4Q7J7B4_9PSEU|nr:MarR family transcriptional regulator [Amycolatopsis suaedae]RZQ61914.1 MarR family transcriptional regulator [Amycolatopsis suaedae]
MSRELDPDDHVDAIALAWQRERPGTPVDGIGIITRLWHAAKLVGDDRRRVLADAGADTATLDLLGALRRAGPPYTLTTRELADRAVVSPGAISQRVARAERAGLVVRAPDESRARAVAVTMTEAGHATVERLVDRVLGREAELVATLDPEQRDALASLLAALIDGLHRKLGEHRYTHVGGEPL